MRQTTEMLTIVRRTVKVYDDLLKPVCVRYRLSSIEAVILSFLHSNPERDTAANIAELRMLPKSNVSLAVESLIRKSLLVRRQDTRDRRKIHLSLTPAAEPVIREIEQVRLKFYQQVFQGFTKEERQQFANMNARIAKNMEMPAGDCFAQ